MTDKLPFTEIEKLLVQHIVAAELRDFYRRRIGDEISERLQMAIAKHLKAYEGQQIKSKSELEKVISRIAKDFLNPKAFQPKKEK